MKSGAFWSFINLEETEPKPVPPKQANQDDEVLVMFLILKVYPECRAEVLAQLQEHVSQSRHEEGNLLFEVYTVNGDETTIMAYEHWRNASAVFDVHVNQPYSQVTGPLLEKSVVGDLGQYMNLASEIA